MNKAEKQAVAESLRNEATVLRQTRENYKEARANIEEKLKVLSERTQTQSVIWQRQYQEALHLRRNRQGLRDQVRGGLAVDKDWF